MKDMSLRPDDIGVIDYCDEDEHSLTIGKMWLTFSWSGLMELRNRIDGYILVSLIPADQIEFFVSGREEARRNKDYEKADAIKSFLLANSIRLEDTPDGVRWKRED